MPSHTLTEADFRDGQIDILGVLVAAGLCASRGDARRNVQQGGVSLDGEKVTDIAASYTAADFRDGKVLKKGKKSFVKVLA